MPLARLALATGPTEVRAQAAEAWFTCPPAGDINAGSVSTPIASPQVNERIRRRTLRILQAPSHGFCRQINGSATNIPPPPAAAYFRPRFVARPSDRNGAFSLRTGLALLASLANAAVTAFCAHRTSSSSSSSTSAGTV